MMVKLCKSKRPDDDPDYIDEDENKVKRRKYRKTKTGRSLLELLEPTHVCPTWTQDLIMR